MKRDWDLCRAILMNASATGNRLNHCEVAGFDAQTDKVNYHLDILGGGVGNAGFIELRCTDYVRDQSEYRLTWAGQECLAMIEEIAAWDYIKASAEWHGVGLTLDVIRLLADDCRRKKA